MNPLSADLQTGTLGELLVQLRLLQHDVQSVAPHKDTGNDLLAVKGEAFRAIQVKTFTGSPPFKFDRNVLLQRSFHILALVQMAGEDRTIHFDQCAIYLLRREEVTKGYFTADELSGWGLSERVQELFDPTTPPNNAVRSAAGAPAAGTAPARGQLRSRRG